MKTKQIIEKLEAINISLGVDIECWQSPYCPSCMIDELIKQLKEDQR